MHLILECLGDGLGLLTVVNDIGHDQHDHFCPSLQLAVRSEQASQNGNLTQKRNPGAPFACVFGNHAAQQHRPAISQAQGGADFAVIDAGTGNITAAIGF